MSFLQKIFGSKNQRELKRMHPLVVHIGEMEKGLEAKTDAQLRAITGDLRQKLDNGASLDDILP